MRKLIDKLPKPYQNAPHNWDIRYISEVATIATGDSNTQDKVENGKYPFFVRSQTVERTNKYTFDGKAILTAGDGVGVGKVFHLVEGKFALHQRVYRISDFLPSISPEFLFLYFSNNFIRQVNKFTAKTSVDSVRLDMIAKMVMPIPPLPEQCKIAQILSTWDKAISTTERLIDNSKQQKKSLMQQLLTGKKRLLDDSGKAFEGEWVEVKLGDISYITTGSSNREDSTLVGEYAFFDRSVDTRTSSQFLFDGEAIIVPGEGQEFIPKYFNGKFDLHQRTYAIMNLLNSDGKFLYYSLSYFSYYLLSQAVGSTVKSLRLPMFKKMPIQLPSKIEQQKIASVLTSSDKEIELLQQQLTDLKQEKRALMQQLLTGKRRVKLDDREVA
jgi:type I restriction enzyme S subunit